MVPPEVAGRWLEALLALNWKKVEPAAFAATQIARLTGDRSRDLPAEIREKLLARLRTANALASWIDQVTNVVELDRADQGRAFGESLPAGLRLVPERLHTSSQALDFPPLSPCGKGAGGEGA